MRPVEFILSKLEGVRQTANGWEAHCPMPSHPDSTQSFQVAEGDDARVLINCRGCGASFEQLCAALGIERRQCFPESLNGNGTRAYYAGASASGRGVSANANAKSNGNGTGKHNASANGNNGNNATSPNVAEYGAPAKRSARNATATTDEIKAWDGFAGAYVYTNEDGTPRFMVVRVETRDASGKRAKTFSQWRSIGPVRWGRGLSGKDDAGAKHAVLPTLYRYGEVRAAVASGLYVYLVEGERDVETLVARGLVATCNPMGAGSWKPAFSDMLTGAQVVILPDNDDPGRDHVRRILESLPSRAKSIRIVNLPGLPEKGDVSDWFAAGHTKDELWSLVADAAIWAPVNAIPRPVIIANDQQLMDMVDPAIAALVAHNTPPTMFVRGDALVRIRQTPAKTPAIELCSPASIRVRCAQTASWHRQDSQGKHKSTTPPLEVVQSVLALPTWPFPHLQAVIESPVYAKGGALLTTNGYHPGAELYLHQDGLAVPDVPEDPSPEDIDTARSWLDELIGDFPFVDEASRAHTYAAILHPFVRPMIDGPTPLHVFDAPTAGTGKSLLADVVAIVGTGHGASTMTESRDEDEWRKRLTAKLMRAPAFLLIDNISRRLDSSQIAAALTATTWEDRMLGESRMVTFPVRCCWMATANNVQASGEISRRIVHIRLDSHMEQPFNRTEFRHPDIVTWAHENRSMLVWSALTLVRRWIVNGRPPGSKSLGSFVPWARTMSGILEACGIPGLLANMQSALARMDEDLVAWRALIATWVDDPRLTLNGWKATVKDLFGLVEEMDVMLRITGTGDDQSRRTRFGIALRKKLDCVIGGCRIKKAGETRTGATVYVLETVDMDTLERLRHERAGA